jgi:hypothetical protein
LIDSAGRLSVVGSLEANPVSGDGGPDGRVTVVDVCGAIVGASVEAGGGAAACLDPEQAAASSTPARAIGRRTRTAASLTDGATASEAPS